MKKFYINQIKTFIYNEETFYEHENEIETFNELNTTIETVLLYDDEIFIFGCPARFIINKFINDENCLENFEINEEGDYDSKFKIIDYSLYENQIFYLKIDDNINLKEFLAKNKSFILLNSISIDAKLTKDE